MLELVQVTIGSSYSSIFFFMKYEGGRAKKHAYLTVFEKFVKIKVFGP